MRKFASWWNVTIHTYVRLYLFPESVEFVCELTMQYINTLTNNFVICIDIPRLF